MQSIKNGNIYYCFIFLSKIKQKMHGVFLVYDTEP
jgi:hypothetical protein